MARPILMPQVGQDLTEGKLTALNVKVGDKVKKGDIVAEVESEKAVFEVEAFETGTVLEVRYQVGDMAVVLEPLMMVGEEGEQPQADLIHAPADTQAGFTGEEAQDIVSSAATAPAQQELAADVQQTTAYLRASGGGSSPLARRLAAMAGVDIASVEGTGPHGAVVRRDIEALQQARKPGGSVVAFTGSSPVSPAARTSYGEGLPIKLLQAGTGDPLVLIHGFGAELSAWRPFVAQLGLSNPVYALDLPAHGGAADRTADGFDTLVASVHATLAGEGMERLHLAGHSLGAAIAAAIAGGGDLDIRSLTLIAPAGLGPGINGDYLSGFLSAESEPALKAWLELLVFDRAALPGVLVRATLAARQGTAMAGNQKQLAAGVFAGSTQLFSIREALARFAGPLRVIVGREDRIIPPDHADALPAHAALHRLPQVGHLPQLEAAALVGRLVSETIRSAG